MPEETAPEEEKKVEEAKQEEIKVEETPEKEIKPEELIVEEQPKKAEAQTDEPMIEEAPPEFKPEEFEQGPDIVGNQEIENQGEPEVEDATFNLDEMDENAPDFEPIPIGWYEHTIINAKYAPSKSGDPMMTIEFTMTDEKHPAYLNRRISLFALFKYQGSELNPVAKMGRKRFKKAMVRARVPIDWGNFKPVTFANSGIALGKKLRLHLGLAKPWQNDEGVTQRNNSIKDFQSVGSGDDFLSDKPV